MISVKKCKIAKSNNQKGAVVFGNGNDERSRLTDESLSRVIYDMSKCQMAASQPFELFTIEFMPNTTVKIIGFGRGQQ